jgi:hypothetical protein
LRPRRDFDGDVGTIRSGTAGRAARSSCNRASYPGDGVTVGGAARIGDVIISDVNVTAAAIAQTRFIAFPSQTSANSHGLI